MRKFISLIIFLSFIQTSYALNFDDALNKIGKDSKLSRKLGCDLGKEFSNTKGIINREIGNARKTLAEIKEKSNNSFNRLNNKLDKIDEYEKLAKDYLGYLKLAVYIFAFFLILLFLLILFFILRMSSIYRLTKKISEGRIL